MAARYRQIQRRLSAAAGGRCCNRPLDRRCTGSDEGLCAPRSGRLCRSRAPHRSAGWRQSKDSRCRRRHPVRAAEKTGGALRWLARGHPAPERPAGLGKPRPAGFCILYPDALLLSCGCGFYRHRNFYERAGRAPGQQHCAFFSSGKGAYQGGWLSCGTEHLAGKQPTQCRAAGLHGKRCPRRTGAVYPHRAHRRRQNLCLPCLCAGTGRCAGHEAGDLCDSVYVHHRPNCRCFCRPSGRRKRTGRLLLRRLQKP